MPFWVQNGWFKDFKKILFGLNGPFWGQKASFKTVLGPILEFFRRYYSWLPWSDPNNIYVYYLKIKCHLRMKRA